MNLLIVGYSNIVKKKALTGISQVEQISKIDVVSASRHEDAKQDDKITGTVFNNYDTAFDQSDAEVAYVSVVNSQHYPLAKKALEAGMHVIVDKPSFMNTTEMRELVDLANSKNLCLAEAIIYFDHPQVIKSKEIFEQAGCEVNRITSIFSFPPFPNPDGYQYKPELGGGAIYDNGPYAISPGKLYFGTYPTEIKAIATHKNEAGLETSFSYMAIHPGNKVVMGHFGFNSAYKAQITLLGSDAVVDYQMPFSPPAAMEMKVQSNVRNEREEHTCEPGDNFKIYFEKVMGDINSGKFQHHIEDLVGMAESMEMLRASVG